MVVCARVCVLLVCAVCAVKCACGVCAACVWHLVVEREGNREVDMEPGARLIKIN